MSFIVGQPYIDFGPNLIRLPPALPTSVIPNQGIQGKTVNVTVIGSFFTNTTTFSFGTGITVSSLVIVNMSLATMTLTISATAPTGFHNLTASDVRTPQTLPNAFFVLPLIFGFQQSGLDPRDMAVLGNTGTQILYWDYSNTQDFYIQVAAGQFGLTRTTLFAVSPQFASNWFGNQAPSVTYDPFNFNQSKPSSL